MTFYVIGASGLIGNALVNKLLKSGQKVVSTRNLSSNHPDHVKLDLKVDDLSVLISSIKSSDTVYLLAAYSNPSWIFAHQEEAIALNRNGTKRLIDALRSASPHLIFMSSVEVFDGISGSYAEEHTPNPLNFYGQLKYEIEQYINSTYSQSTIVRTGWNIGANVGSRCVVKLTYESLLAPDAKMANDNVFSIIDANDTAEGLSRLSSETDIRKIHLAADRPLKRTELAELIMKYSLHRSRMNYSSCSFADIPYTEPRGRLNNLKNDYSKLRLGINYGDVVNVVRAKVALLDSL
jgi:dTDP-4-dehydrorhamnose reductase